MDKISRMIAAVDESKTLLHLSHDLKLLESNLTGPITPEKARALGVINRLKKVEWYQPLEKLAETLAGEKE